MSRVAVLLIFLAIVTITVNRIHRIKAERNHTGTSTPDARNPKSEEPGHSEIKEDLQKKSGSPHTQNENRMSPRITRDDIQKTAASLNEERRASYVTMRELSLRVLESQNTAELERVLSDVIRAVPTPDELRKAYEKNINRPPAALTDMGYVFGALDRRFENGEVGQAIEKFYTQCGLSGDLPQPMRSVCIARALDTAKTLGHDIDSSLFDERLMSIALPLRQK